MHARYQELISMRDGEPVAADIAQHIAHCERCATELQQLRALKMQLRQLPLITPPAQTWSAIQQRLTRTPAPRHVALFGSLAAGALAVLALLWSINAQRQPLVPMQSTVMSEQPVNQVEMTDLITRSQQLEALLKQLPKRPAVERAATTATIDSLQQRIQLLDLQLAATPPQGSTQLWSERVRLLNSLLGLRYAEATRAGYQLAINDGAI